MDPQNLSRAPGATLFDSADAWHREPLEAFRALLASPEFALTRRRDAQTSAASVAIRGPSATVYEHMFGRFLRHLEERQVLMPRATSVDAGLFFTGALDRVSRETYQRYLRLVERIYDHLVDLRIISANPISAWVRDCVAQGEPAPQKRPSQPAGFITAADVVRLQDWLYTQGCAHAKNWKQLRDITLASIGLGTGMRCHELLVLQKSQVRYFPGSSPRDLFEFDIPSRATVPTAKAHDAPAEAMSAHLMERWWLCRWAESPRVAGGPLVFPATSKGGGLEKSTLYRNFKALARAALERGVLSQENSWVLERGAQGLRRAYALTQLERGEAPQILTHRLGHHHERPVQRTLRELDSHHATTATADQFSRNP